MPRARPVGGQTTPCRRGWTTWRPRFCNDHPDRAIFHRLRGAGRRLPVRTAAEFGEARTRFGRVRAVAAYAGVAPVTRQSGKSHRVHFRRARCKPVGATLHQVAFRNRQGNDGAWTYYQAKRRQGKPHAETLCCRAMIGLRIVYAMRRDRVPHSAEPFLQASRRQTESGGLGPRGPAGPGPPHASHPRSSTCS